MDDAEFRKRLSEVAEWTIPDTPRETSLNAKKTRGRKSREDAYCELHEEIFLEEFGGINPTYAPMLVRIKRAAVNCEHCGEYCPNGLDTQSKMHDANNIIHWRQKCLTCNRSKNPYTGKFDLPPGESSVVWNDFLRDSKGVYKTAKNVAREISQTPSNMKTRNNEIKNVIEDSAGIITIYSDLNGK